MKTKSTVEQSALRLLARREHSALQLMQKLTVRGFALDDIRRILDEFTQKNWLSNERFAQSYTQSRVDKGFGPVHIAAALRERGINDALIQQALAEYHSQWPELIESVYTKRFGTLPAQDDAEKAKRQQFLLYRGFTYDQIRLCKEE